MDYGEHVLKRVYEFFVKSHDFNGILLIDLSRDINIAYLETIDVVKRLVEAGDISIQASSNPHIIGLGHYDLATQLKILDDAKNNKKEPWTTSVAL